MKAGLRPQYYGIRRIVQMVKECSSSGYPPNSSDFIKEFGVSRRTVSRDLDFLEFARHAFGIVGGSEPIKVRLLFEPKLAVYITERQWHTSQKFITRKDGRVEMQLETTGWKELVRWILSWVPDVKILAPTTLRDRILLKLKDGLKANARL